MGTAPETKGGQSAPEAKGKLVQRLDEFVNSDLTAQRNEYHFRTPFLVDACIPLMKDERDLPMVCLMFNIIEYLALGITCVYGVNFYGASLMTRNIVGFGYCLGLLILFFQRFILWLHYSSHRSVFKVGWLNLLPIWVFAPFFGIPCGVYKLHHCIMHHTENNRSLDISSTEMYQRDSPVDFLKYWFRFMALIWFELPFYSWRTNRMDWFLTCVNGVVVYLGGIALLAKFVNLHATIWVFCVPYAIAFFAMSFGNWSQHMFVDPTEPTSNYHLAYNCLDHKDNMTTFNDGYHVVHHINGYLHWSEIPGNFYDNLTKHYDGGAITFRGVHFFDVGVLVMTKQLRKLAELHYVHIGPKEETPTVDEVEIKLQNWLRPVPEELRASPAGKKESKFD